MKRFIAYFMTAALVCAGAMSCVQDEKDLFDKSSAARMNETLADIQDVLCAASNGWVMFYYPNGAGESSGSQKIGGYVYTMVFNANGEVTVWSELTDVASTSLYNLAADDGPVLTFDTFNENLHYFATPAGSGPNIYGLTGGTYYQAHKGDFNFKVMSADADEVVLLGKRSRNYYRMYPVPSDTTPEEYAKATAAVVEQMYYSQFDGTIGSDKGSMYVDFVNRQISITKGEETVSSAFSFNPSGLHLYRPVSIGGGTVNDLEWDNTAKTLSSNLINMTGSLPEDWTSYNDLLGSYTFYYYGTTANKNNDAPLSLNIEIKEKVYNKSFLISGIGKTYDLVGSYDLPSGRMSILAQVVGEEPGYYYQLAVYNYPSSSVAYTGTYGMVAVRVVDSDPATYDFRDNGAWSNKVSSFIIYKFTEAGSRVGGVSSGDWSLNTGSQYLRYVSQMVKK